MKLECCVGRGLRKNKFTPLKGCQPMGLVPKRSNNENTATFIPLNVHHAYFQYH